MNRILFVCLGNICRSPLAEGILRRIADERGLALTIDSAGTGDYHIGELPDARARWVGEARGCRMTMRARQVRSSDFRDFDLILAMDQMNLRDLERWPGAIPEKVRLVRSYDPLADRADVPDPYTGQVSDFEDVANMLETACQRLVEELA